MKSIEEEVRNLGNTPMRAQRIAQAVDDLDRVLGMGTTEALLVSGVNLLKPKKVVNRRPRCATCGKLEHKGECEDMFHGHRPPCTVCWMELPATGICGNCC